MISVVKFNGFDFGRQKLRGVIHFFILFSGRIREIINNFFRIIIEN